MLDGIDVEINVEIRPVQVVRLRQLHVYEMPNGNILEPGELGEW
jgi:hypothetical protein